MKTSNLTDDQLTALAGKGVLNHEIEDKLGRKMTAAEKATVGRARLDWKMRRAEKAESKDAPPGGSWRAELDRLKCKLAEYELAQKEGRTLTRADIEEQAKADAALIKTSMLGMANALAPQLVGLKKVTAVRTILNDWARSTLQSWHDAVQGDAAGELEADA
jgi:hypothetical protein